MTSSTCKRRRDSLLSVAGLRTPFLYSLLCLVYSSSTRCSLARRGEVCFKDRLPPESPNWTHILALSVDETVRSIQSEFNVWYR